jgi:hypothetical protein
MLDHPGLPRVSRLPGAPVLQFAPARTTGDPSQTGGLLDEKCGRRGPVKLTAPIAEFLQSAPTTQSGAELAAQATDRFGVVLHRRTVKRARRR